jgi:hypothetical protein
VSPLSGVTHSLTYDSSCSMRTDDEWEKRTDSVDSIVFVLLVILFVPFPVVQVLQNSIEDQDDRGADKDDAAPRNVGHYSLTPLEKRVSRLLPCSLRRLTAA